VEKDLLEIAENYISNLKNLKLIEERISTLTKVQEELNEKILEIEKEWGKFDYRGEKQLEYLEKYFYSLSVQQKEKLSRIESCIGKLNHLTPFQKTTNSTKLSKLLSFIC